MVMKVKREVGLECPGCKSKKISVEFSRQYLYRLTSDDKLEKRHTITLLFHALCEECCLKWETKGIKIE